MRESEIEKKLAELERKIGNPDNEDSDDLNELTRRIEVLEEKVEEDSGMSKATKMQLGKVRNRVKDLEEEIQELKEKIEDGDS